MTTASFGYYPNLDKSISRRRLLQLSLGFSAAITTFKFQRLSKNAELVLACLKAFNESAGAHFDDLLYVANFTPNITLKQVENAVDELIRLNLVSQKYESGQRTLFVNKKSLSLLR